MNTQVTLHPARRSGRARLPWIGLVLLLLTVLAGTVSLPVHAATITVTNINDSGPGSLRQAIADAAAGDTIDFGLTYPAIIALSTDRLTISQGLTISGPGASSLTISGNNALPVFFIDSGAHVTISAVTVAGGYAGGDSGGGIKNHGTLMVTNSIISDGRAYFGGGIYNQGTVTVIDTAFYVNRAYQGYGGAIHNYGYAPGLLTVTRCTFEGNEADYGGAIYGGGTMTVTDSAFIKNIAYAGSGLFSWGTAHVVGTVFVGNTAADRGTITNNDTLHVTGCTFSDNNALYGNIHNDGTATVTRCAFSGNSADTGGGIDNDYGTLDVISTTFSGNDAVYGGAIFNNDESTLHVTASAFSGNTGPSDESYGGGIDNAGMAALVNSTFAGNSAYYGGGIGNWGTLAVTNCTFYNNSATEGGGIRISTSSGTATVKNTIVASSPAGGNCYGVGTAASTNNLSTDGSCTPGFTQVTPAQLALGMLGGTPAYLPLKRGSMAIDAGTNSGCPAADQRGVARPQDGNGDGTPICDVGSYEYERPDAWVYLPVILNY